MTNTISYTPGSIVSCRDRQWVVLPSEIEEIIRLRPLSGNEDEIAGIYRQLGVEQIEAASFPLPNPKQVRDHTAALLLMNAARLLLRSGAGPNTARLRKIEGKTRKIVFSYLIREHRIDDLIYF